MLATKIGRMLRERNLTLSVAESCTGGRLGDIVTDVPGSSDYFLGGVISYSNESKVRLLGVRRATLRRRGAVSEAVALQMADGARQRLHADVGVGITGIAGPSGGTRKKPVGLVYIAVSSKRDKFVTRNLWKGSRDSIKRKSVAKAIEMLESFISEYY